MIIDLGSYETYLRDECEHSERTVLGYLADLRLISAATERSLSDSTYEDFTAWIRESTRRGLKAGTITRRINALKNWLKFVGKDALADRLTRPKKTHALRSIPNVAEVRRLLESATDLRDRAILETLYCTGVRNFELCQLRIRDVGDEVRIVRGKGGKARAVPLSPVPKAAIAAYLATRPAAVPDDLLFLRQSGRAFNGAALWRLITRYGRVSKQRVPLFPHLLRHAFASHLLQAGVNLRWIQSWLGHSDIKATEIYLHYDVVDARAMVLKCLPRERVSRGEPAERPMSEMVRPVFSYSAVGFA